MLNEGVRDFQNDQMIKCADAILVRVGFPVVKSLPLPTLDREHQQDFAGARYIYI